MGGAYLSRPVLDKVSEDKSNDKLVYGVSSMQGWRLKQEDAHNCIIDLDENISLFGVYDGHGGFEVAKYTSENFPQFLKDIENFKLQKFENALIEAFLGFDDSICTATVTERLQQIINEEKVRESDEENATFLCLGKATAARASCGSIDDNNDSYEDILETPETLRMEASKPIEEVMASYIPKLNVLKNSEIDAKQASSYLRGRRVARSKPGGESIISSSTCGFSSHSGASNSTSNSHSIYAENNTNESVSKSETSNSVIEEESERNSEISKIIEGSSKCWKNNIVNGDAIPVLDSSIDENSVKRSKHIPSQLSSTSLVGLPSTSLKKNKLELEDVDDSTTMMNFITKDEIAENDDDDSEDENFEPVETMFDSDDDDEDDEDDDDEDEEDDDSNVLDIPQRYDNSEKEEEEELGDEDEFDYENKDVEDNIYGMFTDEVEKPGVDSGCTAVVALIKDDDLYVANAGDSRCILCKAGKAIDMSEDHKPEDKIERERITNAGGTVTRDGRVSGGLNLSRALGDHRYKKNEALPNTEQMITALPDIRKTKLESDVEFIVLACDGIWNSMSSQEVVDFVRAKIHTNEKLSAICEELFDKCLASDTLGDGEGCDNMTCIIVKPKHNSGENIQATGNATADSASDVSSVEGTYNVIKDKLKDDEKMEKDTAGSEQGNSVVVKASCERTNDSSDGPPSKAVKRGNRDLDSEEPKRLKTNDSSTDELNAFFNEAS